MKFKGNMFTVLIVVAILFFLVTQTQQKVAPFPTGCTAPPGAQVVFRTNVTNYFGLQTGNAIAVNFDAATKQIVPSLIGYRYTTKSPDCFYDITNLSAFSAFLVSLNYNIPNGASAFYDSRANFQYIYFADPTNCSTNKVTMSWYSKASVSPNLLQSIPLEPYTTQCKEVYNIQSCIENWQCTEWSQCSGGTQTRTCTDLNACGTTVNKPIESQSCTVNYPYSTSPPPSGYCYQETANVATACGGLATGSYYSADFSGLDISYAIPPGTASAVLKIRATHNQVQTPTDYYINIPSLCLSKSNGLLEFHLSGGSTAGSGSCGASGENIFSYSCKDNTGNYLSALYSSGGLCCANGNNYGEGVSSSYDGNYNTAIASYNGFFREGFNGAAFYEEAIYWNIGQGNSYAQFLASIDSYLIGSLDALTFYTYANGWIG